ncbi:MAG TPA: NADH-quinone oxidoreductase subunit L [Saccharospirillum sp.]|nr:NADH-quinone oxidoreductase subunit L [Saccharospirillum sp.]
MPFLTTGWLLPAVYAIGWLLIIVQPRQHWRIARTTGLAGVLVTLLSVAAAAGSTHYASTGIDALGLVGAALVSVLGWVIIHFSSRYLTGDPLQSRFIGAMLFTLTSVGLLLLSRHLLIIVLAWTGTSVGLHFLLTHYPNRKAAQIVAHKKFLVSRCAELCLAFALILIYRSTGTLWLDDVNQALGSMDTLPVSLHLAAALIALAAILKTAQLPLHGWLIQVMEAPTPVSALLHAGVVNMGGFVLIRLADLITLAPAAQWILVVAGSTTAVLASLVMMTRISIKVRLAWSTCAQMGFMLLEIGLGLYELALLHLIAHSLYKAHAFLSAGQTVELARQRDFAGASAPGGSPMASIWAVLISGLLIAASVWVWRWIEPTLSLSPVTVMILALGLAPLLWFELNRSAALLLQGVGQVIVLIQLYLLWHLMFASIVPPVEAVPTALTVWVVLCFIGLYSAQFWLRRHPLGRFARTFYPWAYNGFYLDETFTRVTFRIWPAKLSPTQAQTRVNRLSSQPGELL